jgi:hypothetical protein
MADGDNYPIKAKASTWRRCEDEFNAKFAAKTLEDGVQMEPARPVRLAGSLNTHSRRVGTIFKDFHQCSNRTAPNEGFTHPGRARRC